LGQIATITIPVTLLGILRLYSYWHHRNEGTVKDNPWRHLPTEPQFVLESDRSDVLAYNAKPRRNPRHSVQLDILPEPFIGSPDAPVVLLSNNPGYAGKAHLKRAGEFRQRMLDNLLHKTSRCPFLYLDPSLGDVGRWWRIKLKILLARCGDEVLARSLLNVVFFPYPSNRFAHRRLEVPSRQYGFRLVRDAIKRGAVIVFMRRDDIWKEAVPELKKYDHCFQVRNVQNPAISPDNCPDGKFEMVVEAIETAEKGRQRS
jgi:hypothetical protein